MRLISALVANPIGEIFELEGYAAVGMVGATLVSLTVADTRNMAYGGELMFLPDRQPILYNIQKAHCETVKENPRVPGEILYPVAVFNSPGYVVSHMSAYKEKLSASFLPLFSYGAVGWHKGRFRSAAILIDRERRQDLRRMKRQDVIAGIHQKRKLMPSNRLRAHLEKCALSYGCPAGKNFFLGRYEAPLPTARHCNASCLGCISLQNNDEIPSSQHRLTFRPSPEEIAEVALSHILSVKKSVVSFGQGCEGEPLLAADVIEPSIRLIRATTRRGTINLNTNGSQPEILNRLFDVGLDSIRVSMNSVRETCYNAYFRPKGYDYSDVLKAIDLAVAKGKFVAINYLNCPGFTDTPQELEALIRFVEQHPIHMIQWRNLNFDPLRYWKIMNTIESHGEPIGMQNTLRWIRQCFPNLKFGYFNPPKEKFNKTPLDPPCSIYPIRSGFKTSGSV
jgi:pyruvate-formate lyase-activating enzyme